MAGNPTITLASISEHEASRVIRGLGLFLRECAREGERAIGDPLVAVDRARMALSTGGRYPRPVPNEEMETLGRRIDEAVAAEFDRVLSCRWTVAFARLFGRLLRWAGAAAPASARDAREIRRWLAPVERGLASLEVNVGGEFFGAAAGHLLDDLAAALAEHRRLPGLDPIQRGAVWALERRRHLAGRLSAPEPEEETLREFESVRKTVARAVADGSITPPPALKL